MLHRDGGPAHDTASTSFQTEGSTGVRFRGRAYTVRMVLKSETRCCTPQLPGHFVHPASGGSVAFIYTPIGAQNVVWGSLMTAGDQARGRLGAVVSDRIHDIAKHHAAGFAVFPLGTSTTGNPSSVLLWSK